MSQNGNNKHQQWCQWFTPPKIAQKFLQWANIDDDDIVLDPAAGEGILMPDRPGVLGFEIDPSLFEDLRYWRPYATVLCHDFLSVEPLIAADVAISNPPYSNEGEGTFLRQSLRWAPRACFLVRTVALHGRARWEKCWRFVQPTRISILTHRPRYLGPGGIPTKFNPMADYMALEAINRPEPLPVDGYDDWVAEALEMNFVNWRS